MHEENPADPAAAGRPGGAVPEEDSGRYHMRFHEAHRHLATPFGPGWFGERAEGFARFFGTPQFLIGQSLIVGLWIVGNVAHWVRFDAYPFILLNLAFSLQAAYAAPLILLAQTRQADRDKAHTDADARHREDLARASLERQDIATEQAERIHELLRQNTDLTVEVQKLARQIENLTREIHQKVLSTPQ